MKTHAPWVITALLGLIGIGWQGYTLPEVVRRVVVVEHAIAEIQKAQNDQGEDVRAIRCVVDKAHCLPVR